MKDFSLIRNLLEERKVVEAYIICRYTYRIGMPLVADGLFDKLEELVRDSKMCEEYINRTYDDDPVPFDLIDKYLDESYVVEMGTSSPYYSKLNGEKSKSIESFTSYSTCYPFFMEHRKERLVLMHKLDGNNSKTLYMNGQLELSLSRARKGDGFDFTKNIRKALPTYLVTKEKEVKVFSECFVPRRYVEHFRQKYDLTKYKTPKSSAISLLRVEHDREDYSMLNAMAFGAENLGDTLLETLTNLKKNGFSVVPYMVIEPGTVPQDFNKFVTWLKAVMDKMHVGGVDIPTDGLVVSLDEFDLSEDDNDEKNTKRAIALKFEHWSYDYYKARITNIRVEFNRVDGTVKFEIEPTLTKGDSVARIVYPPSTKIFLDSGLDVGDYVYFERNSDAVNIMLHGEKLDNLLK